MTGEEENNEIRKLLKGLPAVKSGNDFLEKLDRRIATLEPERKSAKHFLKEKPGIFERTFAGVKSAWLAPALGLSAAVIFVVYLTFMNQDENIKEQKVTINKTEEKQEPNSTTGNTSSTEISPSEIPDNSEKKTEIIIQPEKNMSENFDYKDNEKLPVQVEQNSKNTDREDPASQQHKLNVEIPGGIVKDHEKNLTEEKSDDMYNDESNLLEKSPTSSNEKRMKKDKSMKTPHEKMDEFEKPIQKNIMDKLNAVNKTNLENLRDKVNK